YNIAQINNNTARCSPKPYTYVYKQQVRVKADELGNQQGDDQAFRSKSQGQAIVHRHHHNGVHTVDIQPVGTEKQGGDPHLADLGKGLPKLDRKSTRLNSSHVKISYAVFCLKKK